MKESVSTSHLLFLRKILFIGSPVLIILIIYFIVNPFGILPFSIFPNSIAEKSTDIENTRKLLRTYKTVSYNAFIFGNSRANAYKENYADYINNAIVIKANSPGESIRNIYNKIRLIDSLGLNIKYAFIHMDDALIGNVNNSNPYLQGPAYIHHPLTATNTIFNFQAKGISFFFNKFYFIPYTEYLLTKKYRYYMKNYFKDSYGANKKNREELVDSLGVDYYKKNANLFPERKSINQVAKISVDKNDIKLLIEIKNIFEKHKTEYIVCFSINYKMIQMNPTVIATFNEIFGSDKVYDFTGKNKVAADQTNFYEESHFRTKAGKIQLDSIFLKKKFDI